MENCDHRAKFHIRQVFSRMPEYTCKKCGATVAMSRKVRASLQIVNVIFIIIMIGAAIGSGYLGYGMVGFVLYLIAMVVVLTLFIVINGLIISYGKFESLIPNKNDAEGSSETPSSSLSTPEDTSGYTQEQLDLMALYDSYAKKNEENPADRTDDASADETSSQRVESYDTTANATSRTQEAVETECVHRPKITWRALIPGNNEFVCVDCNEKITFVEDRKRILNVILLLFSFVAMAAGFAQQSISFPMLFVIALVILLVCSIIQYIFIRISKFVPFKG